MSIKPTKEQEDILDAVKNNKGDVRINAYAGTGKSTTLRMIAEQNPDKRFLYLAFNKAIAKEAEDNFPSNCVVKTVHSLAFKEVLSTVKSKTKFFSKLQNFWKLRDYMRHFKMDSFKHDVPDHFDFCSQIKWVVSKYKLSDALHIDESVLNKDQRKYPDDMKRLLLAMANKLWEAEIDMANSTPMDHNTYLKMWELSNPKLKGYDFILFDEAQDANPAMYSVINKLPISRIFVGDQFQAIYGWNGAINAMQQIEPEHDLFLSKSWRFGSAVAAEANKLLSIVSVLEKDIEGNESVPSQIGKVDRDRPHTIIFRTNGGLALEAIELMKSGKKVFVEGGVKDLCNDLRALASLKEGKIFREAMTRYKPFRTIGEVLEESKIDISIRRDYMFIDKFESSVWDTLSFLESNVLQKRSKAKADAVLTTAHKSKGLEWDQVVLYNDFRFTVPENLNFLARSEVEEFNLLYVSITRAKEMLELPAAYQTFIEAMQKLKGE